MGKKFERFKAQQIAALEESIEFFSNAKKTERELWVAKKFLGRYVSEDDLSKVQIAESDPPDVVFRDIRFEIKEVMDDEYRRHDEYKRDLEEARHAKRYADFVKDVELSKRISIDSFLTKLEAQVVSHGKKYSSTFLAKIDALYYVNLRGIFARTFPHRLLVSSCFSESGFRSISLLFNDGCVIVHAKETAPMLLRDGCRQIKSS